MADGRILSQDMGTKGTDGKFSDIYLNYLVGQILIGGSRKRWRGTDGKFPFL